MREARRARCARSARENNVPPGKMIDAFVVAGGRHARACSTRSRTLIARLARDRARVRRRRAGRRGGAT